MSKYVVNTILLVVSVFLFFFDTKAYSCGDGPCWGSDPCGNYWVGTLNCNDSLYPECDLGSCRYYCPEGADWEYCAGLWGGCVESTVTCNAVIKYMCKPKPYNPECFCVERGEAGFDCIRIDC